MPIGFLLVGLDKSVKESIQNQLYSGRKEGIFLLKKRIDFGFSMPSKGEKVHIKICAEKKNEVEELIFLLKMTARNFNIKFIVLFPFTEHRPIEITPNSKLMSRV